MISFKMPKICPPLLFNFPVELNRTLTGHSIVVEAIEESLVFGDVETGEIFLFIESVGTSHQDCR